MRFTLLAVLVLILSVSISWAQQSATPTSLSSEPTTTNADISATESHQAVPDSNNETSSDPAILMPKVMVVTLFEPERGAWVGRNFTFPRVVEVPGLSPLFPNISCTSNSDVCLATLGEGEINAAASMTALLYSTKFNLTQTYFLINGIAGINPDMGTIGSVGFPQYAIQFGLQYGLDGREVPANWTGSFWNYGTSQPDEYPRWFYGTELFGLNSALRDKVWPIAARVQLNDTQLAMDQRAAFPHGPANLPPAVFRGDVMTSDTYFTGAVFGGMASNLTFTLTNGTGVYGLTAQEDNAVLETLVRAHKAGVADYGRAILYRSASDFDRGMYFDSYTSSSWF